MKKKLLTVSLAAFLAISPVIDIPKSTPTAYADSLEEVAQIDTSDLESTTKAAKYLLVHAPNTFKGDKRAYLERLIKESEELLNIVYKARNQVEATDSLNTRIKNIIRSNLNNRNNEFTVNVNGYTTASQIQNCFLDTAKEDWYFFYSMYVRANIKTKYNPKKTKGDKIYVESATFNVSYREDPSVEKKVEDFANNWVRENINAYDSDFDKVLKIHDFIVTKNQYNKGDNNSISGGYSIYHPASILYGNGGVCNAYATLFDKLATKSGLDVRYATGTSKKTGEAHIWNMVKVDGNWYNIDVTYDDPTITFNQGDIENIEDFISYNYFLKDDNEIVKSRTIDRDGNRPQGITSIDTGLKSSTIQLIDGSYKVVK